MELREFLARVEAAGELQTITGANWNLEIGAITEVSASFADSKVSDGSVLENVDSGGSVNVLKFPAPKWHREDGGRYIGTMDAVILKDPETGWVNIGTYRTQAQDEKTLGVYISPGKHGS